MKTKFGTLFVLLLAVFVVTVITFSSYGPVATSGFTIAGSTSMQPIIEELAEFYMVKNPVYNISVQGGGSSSGIEAALSGVAALGMSSRPLKEDEKGLQVIEVAKDAIAIIVHPSNPVTDLSLNELRGIFSERIKNWKEVGGIPGRINVVTREEGSGTRGAFEEMVMGEEAISPAAVVQDSSGAVREIVSLDKNAVGYISLGIADGTVKLISLDRVKPNLRMIAIGRYKLVRPFLFVYKGKLPQRVQTFVAYIRSDESADSIREAGFIPISETNVR